MFEFFHYKTLIKKITSALLPHCYAEKMKKYIISLCQVVSKVV